MKKHLLTFLCLATFGWANAQSLEDTGHQLINDKVLKRSVSSAKTTTCDVDTVYYGFTKATGLSAIGINSSTSANAVSQYFDCPQPITVRGGTFYAWKANATGGISTNVQLVLYAAGPDSLPTGSPLASVSVAVDTVFGSGSLSVLERSGTFNPVTVSQPYCMVVSNPSTISISMAMSSYTAGDGQGEWLAGARLGSNWLNGYELVIGGSEFDADVLVQPIVSYTIDADFVLTGQSCVPENGVAAWQNTSSPIFFNRMYSVAEYLNVPEFQFTWDYGDGSMQYAVDGAHTYSGTPPWNVTLTDTLFTWTGLCIDTETKSTADQVEAGFSSNATGALVSFTDNTVGPNIVDWSWDFGDGNISSMQNPSHTFAIGGNYEVCLTASSDCNSDAICETINVIVTGVEEALAAGLKVYPNPSNGQFTIELSGVESDVEIELTDMMGRTVYTEGVSVVGSLRKEFALDLSHGAYLLRMTTEKESVVRKIDIRL